MSKLGNDPGQMRGLAYELDREADALGSALQALTAELNNAWWQGADADAFRKRWNDLHCRNVNRVSASLAATAESLRREAYTQEQVSR